MTETTVEAVVPQKKLAKTALKALAYTAVISIAAVIGVNCVRTFKSLNALELQDDSTEAPLVEGTEK